MVLLVLNPKTVGDCHLMVWEYTTEKKALEYFTQRVAEHFEILGYSYLMDNVVGSRLSLTFGKWNIELKFQFDDNKEWNRFKLMDPEMAANFTIWE